MRAAVRVALLGIVFAAPGCITDSDSDAGSNDDAGQTVDGAIAADAADPVPDAATPVDADVVIDAGMIADSAPVDAVVPKDAALIPVDAAPVDAAPIADALPPDMQVDPIGTLYASSPEVVAEGAPVHRSSVARYTVFPDSIDDGQSLGDNPARHDFLSLACSDAGLFGIVRDRDRPESLALRRIQPQPQVFAPFFDLSQGGRRQSGIGSGLLACGGMLWVTTQELVGAQPPQPPRLWTIDPADGTTQLVEALNADEDVGDLACVDGVVYAAIKDTNLRTTNLVRLNPRQDIGVYFDATGHGVGGAATHGATYCDGVYYVSTPSLSAHAAGTVDQPSRILAVDLADASTQVVREDADAEFADMTCLNGALYAVRVTQGPARGRLVRVTPEMTDLGPVFDTSDGFFIDGNYSSLAVCD